MKRIHDAIDDEGEEDADMCSDDNGSPCAADGPRLVRLSGGGFQHSESSILPSWLPTADQSSRQFSLILHSVLFHVDTLLAAGKVWNFQWRKVANELYNSVFDFCAGADRVHEVDMITIAFRKLREEFCPTLLSRYIAPIVNTSTLTLESFHRASNVFFLILQLLKTAFAYLDRYAPLRSNVALSVADCALTLFLKQYFVPHVVQLSPELVQELQLFASNQQAYPSRTVLLQVCASWAHALRLSQVPEAEYKPLMMLSAEGDSAARAAAQGQVVQAPVLFSNDVLMSAISSVQTYQSQISALSSGWA